MKALLLNEITDLTKNPNPLTLADIKIPDIDNNEVLIKISTCGVCHTELDEIEGRTLPSKFPVVLGHQVVGKIEAKAKNVTEFNVGDRVGVAWIHSACGKCKHCLSGNENLCADFKATGRDANGGYAEYMTIPAKFAYPIPEIYTDSEAAPLLCAGAIGYRSVRLTNIIDGQSLH